MADPHRARVLHDLARCRTAAMGGHLHECTHCGTEVPLYNSCRNRHCPVCQGERQQTWVTSRLGTMLAVPHFHAVFTLPSELREAARRAPAVVYGLLVKTTAEVLERLARQRLGARLAVTAVLHTWRRDLLFHPHVHAMVSAGGLSLDGERWVERPDFLFPDKVMAKLFRGLLLERVITLRDEGALDAALVDPAIRALRARGGRHKEWVVYIDPPKNRDVASLLRYLGTYIQRVAISPHRVVAVTDEAVTFRTRGDERLTLTVAEFLDRFLLHVLPPGFRKVRHYGLLAPGCAPLLEKARTLLPFHATRVAAPEQAADGCDGDGVDTGTEGLGPRCPHCRQRTLVVLRTLPPLPRSAWNDTS